VETFEKMEEEKKKKKRKKKHSTKPFNRKSKKANLYSVCQSNLKVKSSTKKNNKKRKENYKKTKQQIKNRIIIYNNKRETTMSLARLLIYSVE